MHPYATMEYAQSLAHWGEALWVPQWNTAVIVRHIGNGGMDAVGIYPFCVLSDKADIAGGLAYLRAAGMVSLTMVFDDYHKGNMALFTPHAALLQPFKTHYVYNRERGAIEYDDHHARALKKAWQQVKVGVLDLHAHGVEWQALYAHLITELQLTGLHAFPPSHHHALATMQGITAIGAWVEDELVSAHLWAGDGDTQHSHLVASNAKGYASRAGFAVNDFSLRYFTHARILNFGGGAGNTDDKDDGLARFKRGFSNDTARSYLCGCILDEERYRALAVAGNTQGSAYFPAYRTPR